MRERICGFKRGLLILYLAIVCVFLVVPAAHAQMALEDLENWLQDQYGMSLSDLQVPDLNITYGDNLSMTCSVEFDLLAKAAPDECFYGLCSTYNYGTSDFPCEVRGGVQGVPKVNQAYVWGMTLAADDKIWFGTAPNTHCLVLENYLGMEDGFLGPSYACELQNCAGQLGDWRPPKIYSYNKATETLVDKTPPQVADTLGIRAAGSIGDVIFLAGPAFGVGGLDVRLFAYKTDGTYLGSRLLSTRIDNETYVPDNIRKWLVANGELYTAVGRQGAGGRVLKWTGELDDNDLSKLWHFDVVGSLDGSGAELAFHEGRIFVSTWPDPGSSMAGLYMSPMDVPASDGLPASLAEWTKVWQVDDYEPDTITAHTYGGGALASFDGYLYWGTMHVPLVSLAAYAQQGLSPEEALEAFWGSYRAISIFRGTDFPGTPDIDLVYGMPLLPKATQTGPGSYDWQLVPNNMGALPMFGLSGFGNPFNNYTWAMQVFGDKLWIGTMDWSYLIGDLAQGPLTQLIEDQIGEPIPENLANLPNYFYGADLFCMTSSDAPALPLCLSGLGNYTNYGIRNMLADENRIYFGMANPMNLLTDNTDDLPEGGWELLAREDLEVDGDLVSADIEDMAPNNGDGNYDGTPDREQPDVASIRPNDSENFITVQVLGGNCSQIRGIMPISNDSLPPDEEYVHPFGNMHILLQCAELSGGSATIRIYYHGNTSSVPLVYRKFGQTEPGTLPQWFTYPNAQFRHAVLGGEPVLYVDLTLTDNALGDFFRHNQAGDGFIMDPGGPARVNAIPTLTEWGMILSLILLGFTGLIYIRKRHAGDETFVHSS